MQRKIDLDDGQDSLQLDSDEETEVGSVVMVSVTDLGNMCVKLMLLSEL